MKRILSILLIFTLAFSMLGCQKEDKHLTCEEIIAAYEEAGYGVFHNHDDPFYYDLNEYCYIKVTDPDNPDDNYIYIDRYFTKEDAKTVYEEHKYNAVLWLFFGIFGEWRWMKRGMYDDFIYETFDRDILKPLKGLME